MIRIFRGVKALSANKFAGYAAAAQFKQGTFALHRRALQRGETTSCRLLTFASGGALSKLPVFIKVRMCRTVDDLDHGDEETSFVWRDWNHIVVKAKEELRRDKGLEFLDGDEWKSLDLDSVALLPDGPTVYIRSSLQSSDEDHVPCPGYIKVQPCFSAEELEKYRWSSGSFSIPRTWYDLDHVKVKAEQILGSSCDLEYFYGYGWEPLQDIRVLYREKRIAEFRGMDVTYIRVPSKYISDE
jgi:hypothetical protein